MKAILIDVENRVVKEIDIDKGIDAMYSALKCDCFTIAHSLPKRDSIFVDDEGLLKPQDFFFTYEGAHQPFAGNGLIMGCKANGDSADCKIDVNEVKSKVTFYDRFELSMAMAFGKVKY